MTFGSLSVKGMVRTLREYRKLLRKERNRLARNINSYTRPAGMSDVTQIESRLRQLEDVLITIQREIEAEESRSRIDSTD